MVCMYTNAHHSSLSVHQLRTWNSSDAEIIGQKESHKQITKSSLHIQRNYTRWKTHFNSQIEGLQQKYKVQNNAGRGASNTKQETCSRRTRNTTLPNLQSQHTHQQHRHNQSKRNKHDKRRENRQRGHNTHK